MKIIGTEIPGCYQILPSIRSDNRGSFVKTYNSDVLKPLIEFRLAEEYYSTSKKNVLRGFHFQTPPFDCHKFVYCTEGKVLDSLFDIRKGSPTYGKGQTIELSSNKGNIILIAPGVAHAFYVLSKTATVVYKTDRVYSAEHDKGIKWDSAGIKWPNKSPILSERDASFPPFHSYKSPFIYK